ncbi:hypothetical protein [Acidovorax sp. NCPPB 4044]|uniref:hypothetical protein n=1 Tax=Acidovorax sp. NCPPB 4044 TaxID=2940490 RepID=UPI0023036B94|nr:hypothetical protein [Acidovorax sp. NCPPB 4044]MDA8522183.1 hypothetical protein [Acidovorax sp. NCPPB 4044]
MLLNDDYLKTLTKRSMQALGGLIVHHYFEKHSKLTNEIQALVLHQVSVLIKDNLLEWENIGATLPINGRGDPTPEDFKDIDKQLNNIPSKIVDASTEIGLCALYTSDHSESLSFLDLLINWTGFLEANTVDKEVFNKLPRGKGWGPTVSELEYKYIIKNTIQNH